MSTGKVIDVNQNNFQAEVLRNGKIVDEFVGAQPEPMVRQFIQRVAPANGHKEQQPAASSAPTGPQSPEARLSAARELLLRGQGCEAEKALLGLSVPGAAELMPLAQFLCQSATGQSLPGGPAVQSDMQQAARTLQQREQAAALYSLLAAYIQAPESSIGDIAAVMRSVFALMGEDNALVKQYRTYI